MSQQNNIFYVYVYIDKVRNVPFYVGKGKGGRLRAHLLNAKKGATSKSPLLLTIAKLGFENGVDIQKVKNNISEAEAFALEVELIARLGRKDNRTGPLLNRTSGGEGISGGIDQYGYRRTGIARKITDIVHQGALIQDMPKMLREYVSNMQMKVKSVEERIIPHIQEMGNIGCHYKGPSIRLQGWQFSLDRKMVDVNILTLDTKGFLKVHGDLPKNQGNITPVSIGYDFGY